jgi:galactokinase
MNSLPFGQSERLVESASFLNLLEDMYGKNELLEQKQRYLQLHESFREHFEEGEVSLFSAPGRTEIGGNHTDHNNGKVLAGSIHFDTIAIAKQVSSNRISMVSQEYGSKIVIDLSESTEGLSQNSTAALIVGICKGFREYGFEVGGFEAYVTSNVLSASGLSSSASFEMLVCSIMNHFYNNGRIDPVTLSKIGQYAENYFWNKPSGLLDQMACAIGGVIAIDFADSKQPVVKKLDFDLHQHGYSMLIVNTGGDHADLTEAYASIPNEMFSVAQALGANKLAEIRLEDIYRQFEDLRNRVGDRAVLRALHFFKENERVEMLDEALGRKDFSAFMNLINASGNSSWKWLQNCYLNNEPTEQSITVALALTESFIGQIGEGACRVHGGGFAGVILVILADEYVQEYQELIKTTIGTEAFKIKIRKQGAICINDNMN